MDASAYDAILSRVDAALRATFPEDYDTRCMYAAFGVRDLVRAAGVEARLVSGDFLFLTVDRDGQGRLLEGFGTSRADGPPSHYWVEAGGRRLDLGPHYLPRRSRVSAVNAPPLCWALASPPPGYARYRIRERHHPDVDLGEDDPLLERLTVFRQQLAMTEVPTAAPWPWTLQSPGSVTAAARRGDAWAQGAVGYLRIADRVPAPF